MADGFETIGWILKVENKATAQVDKIVSHLEKKVLGAAYEVGKVGKAFAAWGDKQGPIGKGVGKAAGLITSSFGRVFGSLKLEMSEALIQGFSAAAKGGTTALAGVLTKGLRKAESGIFRFADAYVEGMVKGIEKAQSFWAFMSQREFSFGELFASGATGVQKLSLGFVSLAKSVGGATKALGGATASSFAGAWKSIGMGLRSGTQNIGVFFQKILNIQKIAGFFKSAGGIVGVLLGPFGKLLDLFSPFIDMIVEMLVPAFETFTSIIKTAFGPLAMTLEIIAQSLATAIVPFIKPLAAFLEIAAVQVGVMIQQFLKGKPEAIFAGLFEILNAARPVLMRLMTVLLDAGKQIGGALFRAMVKVGPALLKLAVGLLNAVIPLIEPLTKIAVVLLEKVFVPMLLSIAGWLDKHMPEITVFIEALAIGLGKFAVQLDDFYSNFSRNMAVFGDIIAEPFIAAIDYVNDLIDVFKMEGVFAGLKRVIADFFGFIGSGVTSLLEMVGLVEKKAEGAGAGQAAALSAAGGEAGVAAAEERARAEARRRGVPGFADGGVVRRPTLSMIGEEGPEAILPLRPDVIERTLAPIIPSIKFPALDRLVELASSIDRTLSQGTMRVLTTNPAQRAPDSGSDIALAPGMVGGGSW